MKINNYSATLDEKMSEFDMWVTPSLGEIERHPLNSGQILSN